MKALCSGHVAWAFAHLTSSHVCFAFHTGRVLWARGRCHVSDQPRPKLPGLVFIPAFYLFCKLFPSFKTLQAFLFHLSQRRHPCVQWDHPSEMNCQHLPFVQSALFQPFSFPKAFPCYFPLRFWSFSMRLVLLSSFFSVLSASTVFGERVFLQKWPLHCRALEVRWGSRLCRRLRWGIAPSTFSFGIRLTNRMLTSGLQKIYIYLIHRPLCEQHRQQVTHMFWSCASMKRLWFI